MPVRGSVEPLLERLAAARVTQLLSREPSLEELFLAQYGADPVATGGPGPVSEKEVVPSGR